MDVSWESRCQPTRSGEALEFHLPYRRFDPPCPGGALILNQLTIRCPAGPPPGTDRARLLGATAAFILDIAHPAVPAPAILHMIGNFACATDPCGQAATISLSLSNAQGTLASALVSEPGIETEATGFGAAHILYEDQVLGLYILEIAPGRMIPPHCHRVMRETELVIDPGLRLQDRPVSPGDAFAWSLGQVHCYRNPCDVPRRILCFDRPRFQPGDEVPIDPPPPLAPATPFGNYLD